MSVLKYKALYDDQCDICQAAVSWLRVLDRHHRVDCLPIDPTLIEKLHPSLNVDSCLRELHVLAPEGKIYAGWDGVALLARQFPITWILGALGQFPPFRWLGVALYRFVARNRYALSKCRGGRCQVAHLGDVRKRAGLEAFWTCYTLGLIIRLPLILAFALRDFFYRCANFFRNFRRHVDLLGGKLSICFLGGFPCDLVPLFFGEQFVMILYDGIAVDPGSPRMRASLKRHLRGLGSKKIKRILATHHHEEHVGNLNWLSHQTGAPLFVHEKTAKLLQPPTRLPWIRSLMIGQTPPLEAPFQFLGDQIETASSFLEVIPTPGHCADHVSLYDPQEKLLLAGDTFMGTYFATPNPDVDSRIWLETLERLMKLDIEIMVQGHGHIHTLRRDIPDVPGVVLREDPKEAIVKKIESLRWIREQIEEGLREGLPFRAVEATCFPWRQARSWENLLNDEMTRLLSLGHFSRSELIRSFVRDPKGEQILPMVYQIDFYTEK